MSKPAREFGQRSTLSALEEIRAELAQLPEHELLHQNVVPVAAAIAGKCATTEQELVCAEVLAHGLTIVVSRWREPLEAVGDALEVRKRAFTLFMRAYGQVRRAVQYLRSEHGDADRLASPLTGKRKQAPRKSPKNEVEISTESAAVPALVEPREVAEIPQRVGLPGSDPCRSYAETSARGAMRFAPS